MTIEQQIDAAIEKVDTVANSWATKFLTELSYGEDPCGELKLFVLGQWSLILQDYKIYNFGDSGAITPEYSCLTEEEILIIIGKINSLSCSE